MCVCVCVFMYIFGMIIYLVAILGDSMVKNSPVNSEDMGSIPESGRSLGKGNSNSFQYSCLENSHGQGRLVGSSPWGCKRVTKESDTT